MKLWAVGMAAMLAAVCAAGSSFGETVTLKALGGSSSLGVSGMNISAANVASYNGEYVGQYGWTYSSDSGSTFNGVSNPIYTYCIQMGQTFSVGNSPSYSVVPIYNSANPQNPYGGPDNAYIDQTAAGQMQLLADVYFAKTNLTGTQTFNSVSGYTQKQVSAAFQLALWEIEYDGGSGTNAGETRAPETFPTAAVGSTLYFASGNFTASGGGSDGAAAITLADYFLNSFSVGNGNPLGQDTTYSSVALANGTNDTTGTKYQDQIWIQTPDTIPHIPNTVPLPAALPAGISLLVGMGLLRKVRNKRQGA